MQTAKIDVTPPMLDWLIGYAGKEEDIKTLLAWKDGTGAPTFRKIEKLSKSLGIPLGYFFLQTPPDEETELAEYRTISSKRGSRPSRNLLDVLFKMQTIQDWMKNYLVSIGNAEYEYVNSCSNDDDISYVADSIMNVLQLEHDWSAIGKDTNYVYSQLRKSISDVGIIVMQSGIVNGNTHRTLDINEFRAFALVDDFAPLIFINTNDAITGRIFSLLHECAHIWLGQNDLIDATNEITPSGDEVMCNAIAAELYVPSKSFVTRWNTSIERDMNLKIHELAHHFHCSRDVIARRALDHGFMQREEYYRIVIQRNEEIINVKKERSGGNYYATAINRIDKNVLLAIDSSIANGTTTYTEAFKLTNTSFGSYFNLINQARGKRDVK